MTNPSVPARRSASAARFEVRDPLIPADLADWERRLVAARGGAPTHGWDDAPVLFTMLAAGGVAGLAMVTVLVLAGLVAGLSVGVVVFALGVAGALPRAMRAERRQQQEDALWLEIRDRWTLRGPVEAKDPVVEIATGIAGLPATLRGEFAPLMETVRACLARLADEANPERRAVLVGRLRERAAAVAEVVRAVEALEAEQRAQEAALEAERQAALDAVDDDGADLVRAWQVRDEVLAGRDAIRRITHPHQ